MTQYLEEGVSLCSQTASNSTLHLVSKAGKNGQLRSVHLKTLHKNTLCSCLNRNLEEKNMCYVLCTKKKKPKKKNQQL